MSVMPSFNYNILTLYRNNVITIFWHVQIFLCPPIMAQSVSSTGTASSDKASRDLRPLAWPLDAPRASTQVDSNRASTKSELCHEARPFLPTKRMRMCWWLWFWRRSLRGVGLRRGTLCGLRPASPIVALAKELQSRWAVPTIDVERFPLKVSPSHIRIGPSRFDRNNGAFANGCSLHFAVKKQHPHLRTSGCQGP
jgi:hypothetical protein